MFPALVGVKMSDEGYILKLHLKGEEAPAIIIDPAFKDKTHEDILEYFKKSDVSELIKNGKTDKNSVNTLRKIKKEIESNKNVLFSLKDEWEDINPKEKIFFEESENKGRVFNISNLEIKTISKDKNWKEEKYSLDHVVSYMMWTFENNRQSLYDKTRTKDVETVYMEFAEKKLDTIHTDFQKESAKNENYWTHLKGQIIDNFLPKYMYLAQKQTELERKNYKIIGSKLLGDSILLRAAYATTGFVVGFIILRSRLPIWFDEFPFLMMVGSGFIPTIQRMLYEKKYTNSLIKLNKEISSQQKLIED